MADYIEENVEANFLKNSVPGSLNAQAARSST
jgi:hypothetical protein